MAKVPADKDKIVDRLARLFRGHGYEGASLALISSATGLGKSSLYYHFPRGKEDMADAALAQVGEIFRADVLAPLLETGPVHKRLARFSHGLDKFYAGGKTGCLTNVFNLGDAGDRFQPELGKRVRRLVRALADTLVEAGLSKSVAARRAEDAIVAIQGALVVGRALGSTETFRRVISELPDRLLDPVAEN